MGGRFKEEEINVYIKLMELQQKPTQRRKAIILQLKKQANPFFDWVVYFSGIELQELLVYF